jgi:hypothetical protein
LSTWSRSIFVCSYINKFMCVRNWSNLWFIVDV